VLTVEHVVVQAATIASVEPKHRFVPPMVFA